MGKKIVNLIFLRLNQIKRLTQSVGFLLILLFFICVVGIAAAAIQSLLKLNFWWLIGAEFFILMLLSFGRKDRSFLFTIFESRTALILYNFVENIFREVLFKGQKLISNFTWNIQKYHFFEEINNSESYARIFVRCLDDNFLDSMNKILEEKVLNELVNEALIEKNEINNFLLTKDDFPSWYFK